MKDWYTILGMDINSSPDELREAYRKLSDKFNPDLNANDHFFASRFKEIRKAYEVLSDPARRRQYDIAKLEASKITSAEERRRIKRYYSTTKGANTALTVVLAALTLIFAYYVFKANNTSKPVNVDKPLAVTVAPAPVVKQHKKRRHLNKAKTASAALAVSQIKPAFPTSKDTVKIHAVQAVAAIAKPVIIVQAKMAAAPSKPVKQQVSKFIPVVNYPSDVTQDKRSSEPDYLYTTYVKGNETGVIKMRETASYNSATIKTIPNDSKIAVLERGNFYYKVMFENTIGYVPKWTVQER